MGIAGGKNITLSTALSHVHSWKHKLRGTGRDMQQHTTNTYIYTVVSE